MAQFAADSFTGTTGNTLQTYSASWTRHPSYASNALIASGRARGPNDGSNTAYYHIGTPASADYSVSADIYVQTNTFGKPAVFGRLSTSANTGYHARFWAGTGWQLYKVVAGAFTQLGSTVGQTLTAGNSYNLKLEMIGSAIKVYVDGVLTISVTDTAITAAGKAGISFRDAIASSDTTLLHLDNFSADDIGGGGPTAYFQDVSGSLTGAGTLAKQTLRSFTASSTFVGALNKSTARAFDGTVTAAGTLSKLTAKAFAGSMTAAGNLSTMILFTCLVDGSITVTGAITKLTMKALSGASTLFGALNKYTFRTLDGSITPEGILTKLTKKAFAGSVTAAGALAESYQVLKSLAGSITPSGALTALYIAFVAGILKMLALLGVGS